MKCRSCPTDIHWVKSATTGKPAPIETREHPDGNITIRDGRYHVLTGVELEAARNDPDEPLHLNHFATCPKAARHKKAPA
jgi:hypothetical protein